MLDGWHVVSVCPEWVLAHLTGRALPMAEQTRQRTAFLQWWRSLGGCGVCRRMDAAPTALTCTRCLCSQLVDERELRGCLVEDLLASGVVPVEVCPGTRHFFLAELPVGAAP